MVLQFDLVLIGTVLALASSIGAGVWWLHRIAARFEQLEKQAEHRKEDDQVILLALMATLDGLHQRGANGVVTKTLETVKEHIVKSR